jgi:hypothetical protein
MPYRQAKYVIRRRHRGVTLPIQETYVQGESTVDDLVKAMGGFRHGLESRIFDKISARVKTVLGPGGACTHRPGEPL